MRLGVSGVVRCGPLNDAGAGQTDPVPPKYEPLQRYLDGQSADDVVSLTITEIAKLVGGLPPSSAQRTWWANSEDHSQALAWLQAGRRVLEVRPGQSVVFSPSAGRRVARSSSGAAGSSTQSAGPLAAPRGLRQIADGVAALDRVLGAAGYPSITAAVAAHTVFLHPDTVAQTHGQPLFPVVRNPNRRRELIEFPDERIAMFDDNTTPTLSFLWSARRSKGPDLQYNHVWGDPRNLDTYTALWNLCVTPAFLAKTTDGSTHTDVLAALRYRVVDLFGRWPADRECPSKPDGYDDLVWAPSPEPLQDLESELRGRLTRSPSSTPAEAARRLGWLFSRWAPDR